MCACVCVCVCVFGLLIFYSLLQPVHENNMPLLSHLAEHLLQKPTYASVDPFQKNKKERTKFNILIGITTKQQLTLNVSN